MANSADILAQYSDPSNIPGFLSPAQPAANPNVNNLMTEYTQPPPVVPVPEQKKVSVASTDKTASVSAAADQKKEAMGGQTPVMIPGVPNLTEHNFDFTQPPAPAEMTPYQMAVGKLENIGTEHMTEREADMRNMSNSQLYGKYGNEAGNMIAQMSRGFQDVSDEYTGGPRTLVDTGLDSGNAAATGFVSSLAGLANLPIAVGGAVTGSDALNKASTAIAGSISDLNEFVDENQTPQLQQRKRVNEARNALTERDNEVQEQIETKEMGPVVAGLRRIGRDTADSVSNASTDPTVLADGISNAIGSLFAAGPTSKALKALVPETTKRGIGLAAAMDAATGTKSLARGLDAVGRAVVTPLAIGGLEAGGAYQQLADDVMGRSHEDMLAQSPMYRSLLDQSGDTPDNRLIAQREVANKSGLLAAAITGPIAAATGTLVSKFEGDVLAANTVKGVLANTGREIVEEGTQGGTGQLAQNFADQQVANEDASLSKGVGRQVGEGALYAAGSTAAAGVPTLARTGGKAAAKAAAVAGNTVADAAAKRADAVRERNAAASPLSEANINADAAALTEAAPATEAALREAADTLPPEQQEVAHSYVDKLMATTQFDSGEVRAINAPVVEGATNRVEAIQKLADHVENSEPDSNEEFAAGLDLMEMLSSLDSTINSDTGALDALPADHPAREMVSQFDDLLSKVQGSPKITKALASVQEMLAKRSQQQAAPITEESLATPEGQQAVQDAISIATNAPDKGNLDANKTILEHAAAGRIEITPAQKAALDTSVALMESIKAADAEAKRLGRADPVSLNVRSEDGPKGKSVVQHARGIMSAWKSGNKKLAAERLAQLRNFAEHMNNKLGSLNNQFTTGKNGKAERQFRALAQNGTTWFDTGEAPQLHKNNKNSVRLAQKVGTEAKLLTDIYNGMVNAFPDLKGKPLTATGMVEGLNTSTVKAPQTQNQVDEAVRQKNIQSLSDENLDKRIQNLEALEDSGVISQAQTEQLARLNAEVDRRNANVQKAVEPEAEPVVEAEAEPVTETEPTPEPEPEPTPEPEVVPEPEPEVEPVVEAKPEVKPEGTVFPTKAKADAYILSNNLEDTHVSVRTGDGEFSPRPISSMEFDNQAKAEGWLLGKQLEKSHEPVELDSGKWGIQAVVEEAKPEPKGIASLYPNLTSWKGENHFTISYGLPKTPKTRIVGSEDPFSFVQFALTSSSEMRNVVGDKMKGNLDKDIANAYQNYLSVGLNIMGQMNGFLKEFLDDNYSEATPVPRREIIVNGVDVPTSRGGHYDPLRAPASKLLNITEKLDGDLRYNPELIQSAVLAGLQWLINGDQMQGVRDEADISKSTDLPSNRVTGEILSYFNTGMSPDYAKTSLADKIVEYWGVNKIRTGRIGMQEGIAQSVAGEMLRAMRDLGLMREAELRLTETDGLPPIDAKKRNVKDFVQLIPADAVADKNLLIRAVPTAIDQVVMVNPEVIFYIGKDALPSVAKTQMRNPGVKNTAQQLQTIENEQNTEYYVNTRMAGFYNSMGLTNLLRLFGAGEIDPATTNINNLKTLEGVNQGIQAAFEHMNDTLNQVENVGPLGSTPMRYGFNMTRVNRAQMLGKYNPQANKQVREVFMPTSSTLDLSSETTDDFRRFAVAMAQALGIKVHNMSPDTAMTKVLAALNGPLAPVVEGYQDWLKGFDDSQAINPKYEMSGSLVHAIEEAFKIPNTGVSLTHAGLHAIMEYSRWKGNPSKAFDTYLYLEADGVANGTTNAMVLFSTGNFTEKWVNVIAKGGLFINRPGMTMNKYRSEEGGDPVDVYETTTDQMKLNMGALQKSLETDNPEAAAQMKSMLDLLSLMDIGLEILPDGTLKLSRNVSKNPMTITIYGSGAEGIAGNFTTAVMDEIYARMTDAAKAIAKDKTTKPAQAMFGAVSNSPEEADAKMAKFSSSFNAMISKQTTVIKGEYFVNDNASDRTGSPVPRTFTFLPKEIENMQSSIKNFFVAPLREAIAEVIGPETLETAELIRKTTQVQSLLLEAAFNKEVSKALDAEAAANPDFRRSDHLTLEQMDNIYKRLAHMSPQVSTGTQNFFIAGSEMANSGATHFGQALNDDYRTPGYIWGPTEAGVSGIPYLNIGAGDGQAIQTASTMPNAPTKTVKIFDGVHLSLDQIESGGKSLNEAVHTSWQGNPLMALYDSYSKFIADSDLTKLSPILQKKLVKAMFPPEMWGNKYKPEVLVTKMRNLSAELLAKSQEIEARHRVLNRAPISIDQMAATSSPYERTGDFVIDGTSPEEVTASLSAQYDIELAKIRKAEPSEKIGQGIVDQGTALPNGAIRLVQDDLKHLSQKLNLPADQAVLFDKIANSLAIEGYQVTFGTPQQINEIAPHVPLHAGSFGVTTAGDKNIYLLEPSSETLVHELIHAATFQNLVDYYGEKNLPRKNPQAFKAIQRLEALMDQFLDLGETMTEVSPELVDAYMNAVAAIQLHQKQGNNAAALNEFMAWGLTNQHLNRLLKRNTATKLAQIASSIVDAIRAMFGISTSLGTDMYSNLMFNSQMFIHPQNTTGQRLANSTLYHSAAYGEDQRLTEVAQTYDNTVGKYLDRPVDAPGANPSVDMANAIMISHRVSEMFMANGFNMNAQQASAFQSIVAALATEAHIDPNVMQGAQRLYSHVMKTLTVEDFMANPEKDNPNDRAAATRKLDALRGRSGAELDSVGRSTLLPSFLALATVDDGFRKILSEMELPVSEKNTDRTLDAALENMGNSWMESLSERMSGVKKTNNIQQSIDSLNAHLADVVQKREGFIDQMSSAVGGVTDTSNKYIVDAMGRVADKAMRKGKALRESSNNKLVQLAGGAMAGFAGMINEDSSATVSQDLMSSMNKTKVWRPIHELINDIVGRTDSNANVYDLIKVVRSMVQRTRQQFREDLPAELEKRFSRKLTNEEWESLYRSVGKTDLAVLRSKHSMKEIMEIISEPEKLKAEIKDLQDFLKMEDPSNWALLRRKMEQLADHMNTGHVSPNLLRNAHAIANLYGEKKTATWSPKTQAFTDAVDRLTTLYAIDELDVNDRTTLLGMATTEADGLGFTLSYLVGQREEETRKAVTPEARNNAFKGYIPAAFHEGKSLLVASDTEYDKLALKSYTRVAAYTGSTLNRPNNMAYYYAPVQARSTFEQGIMQNVRQSVGGVDATTGYSTAMTAGRITEPDMVKRLAQNLHRDQGTEPLMPIYGIDGEVVAFERSLDPEIMKQVHRESSLHKQIGVWRGRQVEEALAGDYNKRLVDALKDMYDRDIAKSARNQEEYVNLSGSLKDPVLADAVALMTPEIRAYIADVFGEDFYVRKDMLNDAMGYRAASVGDAWTGNSRWSPKTQKVVADLAISVMGNDAYKTMVNAEKAINKVVSDAKVLIVVKSVVVPVTNLISNVYQLIARGVPLAHIVRGMPRKTAEVEAYVKSRLREITAEAEYRAATGDPREQRKLTAELQAIRDSYRRMSIWPLIEAGEFSAISDVGLTREEVGLTSGRLQAYMEGLVNKLPTNIATVGRYALVTKDTALFQGMQKAVEYGDFLAKAILYDDLTQRGGKTKEQALARITEEFVNYDRLPGRFRGSLENLGLLWFYNFKIRSVKTALSMIRNNPVHALLAGIAPAPSMFGSVGLPIEDNIFAKLADGTLDYSIGPGQGLHSIMLNPWVNLTQ